MVGAMHRVMRWGRISTLVDTAREHALAQQFTVHCSMLAAWKRCLLHDSSDSQCLVVNCGGTAAHLSTCPCNTLSIRAGELLQLSLIHI